MALFEVADDHIRKVDPTTFSAVQMQERGDLQRLLRDHIDVVAPDVLIISEEFGDWEESRRRIDLLGVDRDGSLVVVELKRTADGGHMELQAVRYAAMVSTLTAAGAVSIFGNYLRQRGRDADPETTLLEYLGWEDLDEERFGQDVRLVLVAADFSRELTTAVMWLNEKDLDIRCVRIQPYSYNGSLLVDVQQVVPLPESADYQVQLREKKRRERDARKTSADFTRFDVTVDGVTHQAQWKRNAILLVVKSLIGHGRSPDEVSQILAPIRPSRVWHTVQGEVQSVADFEQAATDAAESEGRRFDPRRWHTHDGDLFRHGGNSYVFSNQWGQRWPEAMEALREACPEAGIEWVATGSNR